MGIDAHPVPISGFTEAHTEEIVKSQCHTEENWPFTVATLRPLLATLWDIAISHAHRDTRRHSVYVSMAVQVPTVPSARARGASMHSMTIATIYTVEMGMSDDQTEA